MARNKTFLNIAVILFFLCFLIVPVASRVFAQGCDTANCVIPAECNLPSCSTCTGCSGGGSSGGGGNQSLGTFKGLGPLSDFINNLRPDNPAAATSMFTQIISNIIGVMTIIAVIWFLFTLFIGAIGWLGSGGDKQKLQNSQKQITTALVGLVIVIAAIFFVKIIGFLFGIDILDIAGLVNQIWQ